MPSLLSKLGLGTTTSNTSPPLLLDAASAALDPRAKEGGISGSVLVLLVDQLRDMRHENRNLREEVRTLNSLHKRAEHRIEEIQEENRINMERILSLLAAQQEAMSLRQRISQPPPDPTAVYSRSTALPPRMRGITHILPFLADYQLWKESVVVDDLSKPFAALSVGETKPRTNSSDGPDMPIFIYASPSFTHMTGYELHELLGYPITTLCSHMDTNTRNRVYQFALLPTKSGVGPVFQTTPAWATKRQIVDMHARNQFFFSPAGQPKWLIVVVDQYTDDAVRPPDTRLAAYPPSATVYETDIIYDSAEPYGGAYEGSPSTTNPGTGASSSSIPSPTDDSPESGGSNSDGWSENSDEGMGIGELKGTENLDDLDALWLALGVPSPNQSAGLLY